MRIRARIVLRTALLISMTVSLAALSTPIKTDTGSCGGVTTLPFTDVMSSPFFCQIAEAYFSALTNGTTATTYSPGDPVLREQMAAFVTRTMDQSLKRGSTRAALKQFWTPTSADGIGLTAIGTDSRLVESDGADLWVANGGGTVSRVRASDGKLLETWTGATGAFGVLSAKGLIFVTGFANPTGRLYQIDPRQTAGDVTPLPISLGGASRGIAFDGARVWTASDFPGSVSIVTLNPLSVTTVTTGFNHPFGLLYDGANIWVTDDGTGSGDTLKKLDANGNILQTVTVGSQPRFPVFDGTNIWVPNVSSNTVTVVRASTGANLATLSNNGLDGPFAAAFDGERILITNNGGDFPDTGPVSLWNAAGLTPLGSVSLGATTLPRGVCSDGHHFWVVLQGTNKLARF